jgi:hypothetical protein
MSSGAAAVGARELFKLARKTDLSNLLKAVHEY